MISVIATTIAVIIPVIPGRVRPINWIIPDIRIKIEVVLAADGIGL
jgi:hypothetical protein